MNAFDLIASDKPENTQTTPTPAADGFALLAQSVKQETTVPGNDRVSSFVQQYLPVAERVAKQLGVAPEALLGQWGLETGWGKSVIPGTNNLGNIKDFSGAGTTARDNMTGSVDAYRTYDTADAFADDYAGLLSRRYKSALGTGKDAKRFFAALKANGYAEDPDYVSKGEQAVSMVRSVLGSGNADQELPLIPLTGQSSKQAAEAQQDRGLMGAVRDNALGFAAGVTGGTGALASVFGADNAVARTLDDVSKDLMELQTPQRQAERAQRQQIIKDAEATGSTWEEIKANLGAFAEAPVETIVSAIGSSAPTLLAAFIPVAGQAQAGLWIMRGAQLAVGAAQGAGAVKSSIYEAVEQRLLEEGVDADTAAKVAAGAQAYDSANGGHIAAGAVLGGAAGVVGAEAVVRQAVTKAGAKHSGRLASGAIAAASEAPIEAAQGGQERYASNAALINQGFDDVNPWTGVAGQAALEGVAGAGVGGAIGVSVPQRAKQEAPKPGDALRESAQQDDSPLAKAAVAAGADQQLDAQAQADAVANTATPEQDPEAAYMQELNDRAASLKGLLQDRQVMDHLRTMSGQRMSDIMGDVALATSTRARPEQREQAMSRLEMAMAWAGIGPDGIQPAPQAPMQQPAIEHDNVIQVDSAGNAMGVNERQALREAQDGAEPFTDVTPVQQAPAAAKSEASVAPALPAPDASIAVGSDGKATTMEQRQAQTNAPREPFTDVTPVPGARPAVPPAARAGREATAIRQRRQDLMQQARNGMTTVERRGERFVMVNPATRQEYWLGSTADAALARKAVQDVIAEQAANANTNPSDKQKQTGNYKKGRVQFEGFKIAIENPIGSTRSGVDPNGERWETPMEFAHYGDLEGTKGADGDPIDVYLARDARSGQPAYVIDQYNLDGTFDEHKVVMGAFSQAEALRIYDAGFADGTGPQRRGAVTAMTPAELKAWAKSGSTKKPVGEAKAKPVKKTPLELEAEHFGAKVVEVRRIDGQDVGVIDRLPDAPVARLYKNTTPNVYATQQLLEHLAQAFGKKVKFVVGSQSDAFVIAREGDTIYMNASSEIDPRAVFGHELLHLMKIDHPQLHAALEQAVLSRVPDLQNALQPYMEVGYQNDAQALEELVSDVGGDFMREPAFWDEVFENLYDQHPAGAARKFLKKFYDALLGLWQKLTSGQVSNTSFAETGFGQAMLDNASTVRDAFVQAVTQYARDTGLAAGLGVAKTAQTTGTTNLQNRDRSRAASVAQMQGIATNPDYGRLGISRTPDSGAPMVFATGDQTPSDAAMGKQDVAVMSDGQRVPFTYAVMEAEDLQPSHFADGTANPEFASTQPGTVKALNNGRTAGIKAAYEGGKADQYRKELIADAAAHGVDPKQFASMKAPVLVRLYAEADNTAGMAERSQAQSMGLSASEQAVQDGKLIDASVLSVYVPGDVTAAANLEFARAFVAKLQAAGQDVSKMMQANGTLSSDGANRLRAALVQAAYGDSALVADLFDNTSSDYQAIGHALRDVAGEWANMRDSANVGAINPEADATEHLLTALRMVQKQRRDGIALADQAGQVDLENGPVHPLAIGMLRVLYDGEHFTKARSRDAVADMLRTYVAAANQTRPDGGLLGDVLGAKEIIESLTQGALANAITPTATPSSSADGSNAVPAAQADPQQANAADSAAAGTLLAPARSESADAAQGQPTEQDLSDGIIVREGKGLIKGKFLAEVDGDDVPGGPFNTQEEAREAAHAWRARKAQSAANSAKEKARKDDLVQRIRAGEDLSPKLIESLGLASRSSDVRNFFPIAAELFGLTSRDIRPLVKDLIRTSFTDMGAKREFVPTLDALKAVAAATASQDVLTAYTPEEVTARQAAQAQAAQAEQQAQREAEQRAAADAQVDEFVLTGSDRAADANPNQGDIFGSDMALNIAAGNLNATNNAASSADNSNTSGANASESEQQQAFGATETDSTAALVSDAQKHAKREATKARSKARDARAKGNEELAQRYEGIAETYASVDWDDFARAVEANPDAFIESNVDPVLVYANLPAEDGSGDAAVASVSRIQDQTQTEAFKRWFGDSKVVDAQGKPLVVYHGTLADFASFDPDRQGQNVFSDDVGFFFTDSPAEASAYADPARFDDEGGSQPNVMPVYLAIKNPKIVDVGELEPALWYDVEGQKEVEDAQQSGHDGLIVRTKDVWQGESRPHNLYVAFRPNQIKSATGNNGQFDPANPDIRYSRTRKPAEQGVRLRAIHNLSADNLRFSDEMGGLAVPSIGVVTAEKGGVDGFGEITLVGTKDLADPKREPVFTSDAYTVRFPKAVWDAVPYAKVSPLHIRAKEIDAEVDDRLAHYVWDHTREHPDANELASRMLHSKTAKIMFLRDQGVTFKPKTKKQEIPFHLTLAQFKKMLPVLQAANKERWDQGAGKNGPAYQEAVEKVLKPHLEKWRADLEKWEASSTKIEHLISAMERNFERDIGDALTKWERTQFKPVVDAVALNGQLDKAMKKREPEFADWVKKQVFPMFGEPRLELGRKKVPYTLDNIVEAMTRARDARGQEKTMTYGAGQVRAATSVELRNVEQMREAAEQSIANPTEYEAAKEKTEQLLNEYRNAVTDYTKATNWRGEPDYWQANDDAMKALAKWARGPRTEASLAQALRADFRGVPPEALQKGVAAGNALLNAPVPYFEAKPQRAVAIKEFAGAVIPKKASQETREILAKHGIPMVEYDSNKPEARRAALDKLTKRLAKDRDDVLFSQRRLAQEGAPEVEPEQSLADAVASAPARLGNMQPKAWAAWLRTQARNGRMDGKLLAQLEIPQVLDASPRATLSAEDVAAMVRDAELELAQLQAMVDDHAGTMAQNLRKHGVFAQLCD